ncbi:c-type cytochrome [Achromobacter sp. F4_2707]|uniref:c-type cytochrome n=1 Tax=Achromobacter sp. F4_2707 TaxID=3114286 RepID=UPI0039C7303D
MFKRSAKFASVVVLAAGMIPALASAAGEAVDPAGEKLYKSACLACHMAGVAGAPKLGDKAAWAAVTEKGIDAMMEITVNGKGAMPPRGATQADEATLRAAVEYMIAKSK